MYPARGVGTAPTSLPLLLLRGLCDLLTAAALRAEILLQRSYVSVPAQSVDMLRCGGPVEELKGLLVCLRGAEPSQVAA